MLRTCVTFLAGALAGIALYALSQDRESPGNLQSRPTCRPSHPEQALADTNQPVLLLWGNSLLFDSDWSNTGAAVVNCAKQGQTAQAAAAVTPQLPDLYPDAIMLTFGSVEALQAANDGTNPKTDAFQTAMESIVQNLSNRWPDARLIISSAPDFPEHGVLDPAHVQQLNTALAAVATESRATYLDLADVLKDMEKPSYDGVHMTPEAYSRWATTLSRMLQ